MSSMESWLENQNAIYNYALLAILAVILLWELFAPYRTSTGKLLRQRWRVNLVVPLINFVTVYLIFPTTSVAVAVLAARSGWGLFNQFALPPVVVIALSVLLMDFANYGQHYLLHRVPLLWRLHRAHHSDPEMDVTTSLRFHPFESIVGVVIELAVIIAVGAPVVAVVFYRLARITLSTIVHGNIRISSTVDGILRHIIVTPDIHRVHHSIVPGEHNSNYSGGLIWWDLLFGTYTAQPAAGHLGMRIGLGNYSDERGTSLPKVLIDPFVSNKSETD